MSAHNVQTQGCGSGRTVGGLGRIGDIFGEWRKFKGRNPVRVPPRAQCFRRSEAFPSLSVDKTAQVLTAAYFFVWLVFENAVLFFPGNGLLRPGARVWFGDIRVALRLGGSGSGSSR
jgi:hypothetical protein